MADLLRTVRGDELDRFYRFLERCYGHRREAFTRHYPDVYPDPGTTHPQGLERFLVIESEGELVSHVGVYPLELVLGPARVSCAGIGGVATLPWARGQGYMSRLLHAARDRMREQGQPLSVLWGDRQRYGRFGYEVAGLKYELQFTRRSLEAAGAKPAPVPEADPSDPAVVARVRELHATLPWRVERPCLDRHLRRSGIRLFVGEPGYLLGQGEMAGTLESAEVVSPFGQELNLILAALEWTFSSSGQVSAGIAVDERLGRLLSGAAGWSLKPQGMFHLVDWPALAQALAPALTQSAEGLPGFRLAVGCRWQEEEQWATLEWDGQCLTATPGRQAAGPLVEARPLAAWLLGGLAPPVPGLEPLARLLPVPLHIPSLDWI